MPKELPNSLEQEKTLLGRILVDPNEIYEANIDSGDFYSSRNRKIFNAMKALNSEKKDIDIISVHELVGEDFEYITSLPLEATYGTMQNCVESIKLKAKKRSVIQLSDEIKNLGFNAKSTEEIISSFNNMVLKVSEDDQRSDSVVMEEALLKWHELMDEESLDMGMPKLNALMTGLGRGQLITVAAPSGCGKTTFGLQMLRNLAFNEECLFISLEMTAGELVGSLVSNLSGVESCKVKRTFDDGEKLDESQKGIMNMKCRIIDSVRRDRKSILMATRREFMKKKFRILFIDYAQMIRGSGANRAYDLEEIVYDLKEIAKEFGISVVLLAQVNRAANTRENKEPSKSDIKDSSSIEHASDKILMLYREGYYKNDSSDIQELKVFVRKNRYGREGMVKMTYDMATKKIYE